MNTQPLPERPLLFAMSVEEADMVLAWYQELVRRLSMTDQVPTVDSVVFTDRVREWRRRHAEDG